jgi:hypothetical protein
MAAIYRTLLDEIKRDGCQVLRPAHLADAAAQALDRLAHLDAGMKAAVVGGGWAGLTAAVELAQAGFGSPSSRPPGSSAAARAASRSTGHCLDNGQHI